jgi:hypothetical protein
MKTKMMKVSPRTAGLDLQPLKILTQTEDEMRMHHFVTFSLRWSFCNVIQKSLCALFNPCCINTSYQSKRVMLWLHVEGIFFLLTQHPFCVSSGLWKFCRGPSLMCGPYHRRAHVSVGLL